MTVRNAVAVRDQAAATPSLAVQVKSIIDAQAPAFATVLPKGVDPDRFSRLMIAAVKADPKLVQCFRTEQGQLSVLIAAMHAASLGLEPNTPTQDCWILPRQRKGVQEAQLSIGYRGLVKLVRRGGNLKTIQAVEVRERDSFEWWYGLEADHLEHRPATGDRGDLAYVYAVARFLDGGYNFVVLDRADVERRRAASPGATSADSPWKNWPEAMWRKSAIRALVPFLELSPQAAHALEIDERPLRFDADAGGVVAADEGWPALAAGDEEQPADGIDDEALFSDPATEGA